MRRAIWLPVAMAAAVAAQNPDSPRLLHLYG